MCLLYWSLLVATKNILYCDGTNQDPPVDMVPFMRTLNDKKIFKTNAKTKSDIIHRF